MIGTTATEPPSLADVEIRGRRYMFIPDAIRADLVRMRALNAPIPPKQGRP